MSCLRLAARTHDGFVAIGRAPEGWAPLQAWTMAEFFLSDPKPNFLMIPFASEYQPVLPLLEI